MAEVGSERQARTSSAGVWRARRSRGGDAALWASVALLVLAVAAWGGGLTQGPGLALAGLAVVGLALAAAGLLLLLWAVAYRQMRYVLQSDALEAQWFGGCTRIPYGAIDGIYAGNRLGGNNAPRGLYWPGILVGPGRARGFGKLFFYGTSLDQSHQLVVTAHSVGVVLTAIDPQGFRAALIERADQVGEEGLVEEEPQIVQPNVAPWSSAADAWAPWCIGVGLVLLAATLVVAILRYPMLPDTIYLRFDATGQATDAGSRNNLFLLPGGGLVVLFLNWALGAWFHPREPLFARMLWVGADLIQVIALIALIRLVQ